LDARRRAKQSEAAKALRIRNREIDCDEPASCSANQVKFSDFQMIDQGKQIVRAGRSGAVRVSDGLAEPTTIVSDEPVTCTGEGRDLMFPHAGAAGKGVEKNDRHTATAGILVKEHRSRNIDESLIKRRL
jgi:hypothetical protein